MKRFIAIFAIGILFFTQGFAQEQQDFLPLSHVLVLDVSAEESVRQSLTKVAEKVELGIDYLVLYKDSNYGKHVVVCELFNRNDEESRADLIREKMAELMDMRSGKSIQVFFEQIYMIQNAEVFWYNTGVLSIKDESYIQNQLETPKSLVHMSEYPLLEGAEIDAQSIQENDIVSYLLWQNNYAELVDESILTRRKSEAPANAEQGETVKLSELSAEINKRYPADLFFFNQGEKIANVWSYDFVSPNEEREVQKENLHCYLKINALEPSNLVAKFLHQSNFYLSGYISLDFSAFSEKQYLEQTSLAVYEVYLVADNAQRYSLQEKNEKWFIPKSVPAGEYTVEVKLAWQKLKPLTFLTIKSAEKHIYEAGTIRTLSKEKGRVVPVNLNLHPFLWYDDELSKTIKLEEYFDGPYFPLEEKVYDAEALDVREDLESGHLVITAKKASSEPLNIVMSDGKTSLLFAVNTIDGLRRGILELIAAAALLSFIIFVYCFQRYHQVRFRKNEWIKVQGRAAELKKYRKKGVTLWTLLARTGQINQYKDQTSFKKCAKLVYVLPGRDMPKLKIQKSKEHSIYIDGFTEKVVDLYSNIEYILICGEQQLALQLFSKPSNQTYGG